jgi:hypothetical protein
MYSKLNFLTASYLYEIIKANLSDKRSDDNQTDFSEYIEDNSNEVSQSIKEYMIGVKNINKKPNEGSTHKKIKKSKDYDFLRTKQEKQFKEKDTNIKSKEMHEIFNITEEPYEQGDIESELPDPMEFYESEVEMDAISVKNINVSDLKEKKYDIKVSTNQIQEYNIYKFPLIKFNNDISEFSIYLNKMDLMEKKSSKNLLSFKFKILEIIDNSLLKIQKINESINRNKDDNSLIYYYPNYNFIKEIQLDKQYETFIYIKKDELKILSEDDKSFILNYINTYLKYEYHLTKKEIDKLNFFKTIYNPYIYLL